MRQAGSSESSIMAEWKVRIGTLVWFILGLGFLLSLPVLFGWASWVFWGLCVAAMVLAVPAAWLKRIFFDRAHRRSLARHWIRSSITLLFVLSIVAAAPIYYLATITETRPILFPQATLTNGKKTVVLQGMQHIGSENFYKSVIYDIEQAIADGYVIYYEGVQTATPESREFMGKLTNALTGGGADLSTAYKEFGEACGLKFQSDYFTLLEADRKEHPERHVVADVDAIELKREYERLISEDPAFATAHADDFKPRQEEGVSGSMTQAVAWLEAGDESRKKLAGIICRGVMTSALAPSAETAPGKYDPLILDFRNRALARRILEDPHDKIFVTYGAKHLPGVIGLLKQQDQKWTVATVKWMRTIEVPQRRFKGELAVEVIN